MAVAEFPEKSATVHVTLVTPDGNVPGALLVMVATVQLSPVVGLPNTTPVALHPAFGGIFRFAGGVMVGAILSSTVICELHTAELPATSVTVNTTGFKVL